MKTIENKPITFTAKEWNDTSRGLVEVQKETDYFTLILEQIDRPTDPTRGFTRADIVNINSVRDQLKSDNDGMAEIADSDLDFIKSRIASANWATSAIEFVEFMDYIANL